MSAPTVLRPPDRGAPTAPEVTGRARRSPSRPTRGMDPTRGQRVPRALREGWATVAVGALVVASCLPLARVFVGLDFLWTVLGAAVLALAVDWGCRRASLGPTLTLVASIAAWALFVSVAFLGETLWLGLVPTFSTLAAGKDLWVRGLELIQQRPTPAYAEAGLLLITVNGVWAVAHAVDGLVFRLQSALAGIVMAAVLWCVPLALAPETAAAWAWAVPFLAAAAAVLLVAAGGEVESFGRWHDPRGTPRSPLLGLGALLAVLAITAGVVVAGVLPGFAQGPLVDLRDGGGSTLTGNPIVDIRSNLVASGTSTILTVDTPRPVYIRTTALDQYSGDREEWTNAGIEGEPVRDGTLRSSPAVASEQVPTSITVGEIDGAVLVPTPYEPLGVDTSGVDASLAYDPRLSTLTTRGGDQLRAGDSYGVLAAVPSPTAEELASVSGPPLDPALAALPEVIPPEVPALAREIVDRAGATTWFDQALAIQDELRTWTYSVEGAEEGHSGTAMQKFLASRTGYCEQFAGTMAVMLRSLGIPTRVAVGFTPGQPTGPSTSQGLPSGATGGAGAPQSYAISWSNAHAWVEVDFGQYGWITFEPTPRGDGNVLVPTATNLAPRETVSQAVPALGDDVPASVEDSLNQGDTGLDTAASEAPLPGAEGGPGAVAGARGVRTGLVGLVALALAGVGVVAGLGLRSSRAQSGDPRDQVLAARARVGRLGAGLSAPVTAWETDAEYLDRLVGVAARRSGGERAAEAESRTLARLSAQARWARAMDGGDAARADEAAHGLEHALLARMGLPERALVRARGPIVAGTEVLRQRLGRRRERRSA